MIKYTNEEKLNLAKKFYISVLKVYFTEDIVFSIKHIKNIDSKYNFKNNLTRTRTLCGIITMLYREKYLYFRQEFGGFDYSPTRKYLELMKEINGITSRK